MYDQAFSTSTLRYPSFNEIMDKDKSTEASTSRNDGNGKISLRTCSSHIDLISITKYIS